MHMYGITETCTDLFTALIKAQSQMGSAVKDAKNPHFRSRYASLAAVIDAVIPVLNANGVGVLQLPSIEGSEVQLTTILMHSSGQRLSSTVGAPLGKKQDAQAVGSAITYLRRYSLQSIMGLPVEDDDGNAASRPQLTRLSLLCDLRPQRTGRPSSLPSSRAQASQSSSSTSGP